MSHTVEHVAGTIEREKARTPGEARPVEAAMARGARRLRRETARVVVAAGRRRPRRRAAGGSSAGEGEAGRAWTPRPSAHRSAAAAAAENPLICTNIKQLDRKGSIGMDGWMDSASGIRMDISPSYIENKQKRKRLKKRKRPVHREISDAPSHIVGPPFSLHRSIYHRSLSHSFSPLLSL